MRATLRCLPGLSKKFLSPIIAPVRSRVAADPKDSTPLSDVPYLSDATRTETDLILVDTNRFKLPSEIVTDITAKTDLVIQFGIGILQGDILTAPEHGVLGYHLLMSVNIVGPTLHCGCFLIVLTAGVLLYSDLLRI